jgi:hypothetical protein
MKTLVLAGIAALLLPVGVIAQTDPAGAPAAAPAAPMTPLPKCTAKVRDSCDQSTTTEKNALDHYPADTRDAGNNKIGGATAPAGPARHMRHAATKHSVKTTLTDAKPMTPTPAQ